MARRGVRGKKETSVTIAIARTDETSHGAYRADLPGIPRPAELTWQAMGPLRIADHTFVPPEMRGQGVAQVLVEALVADAREQGFRIVPQCSYVAALFRRHPEWSDLLASPDS
jgi:predicted GNAT family acetyltransferase